MSMSSTVQTASAPCFSMDWFERRGNYALVKTEYADLLQQTVDAIAQQSYASQKAFTQSRPSETASLTAAQIQNLAAKYDSNHMSREDYDAFLEDLCAMGVITEDDKPYLDAGEFPGLTRLDHLGPSATIQSGSWPSSFHDAFSSSGGRVLDWAKALSGFRYYDDVTGRWELTRRAVLSGRIADVLQKIAG